MFKNVSMGPSDHSKNSHQSSIATQKESKVKQSNKDKHDTQFDMYSSKDGEDEEDEDLNVKASDLIFNPESMRRKWLKNHGKSHYIDFSDS